VERELESVQGLLGLKTTFQIRTSQKAYRQQELEELDGIKQEIKHLREGMQNGTQLTRDCWDSMHVNVPNVSSVMLHIESVRALKNKVLNIQSRCVAAVGLNGIGRVGKTTA
jgi:hypothetical protein